MQIKKTLSALLAMAMVVSLVACGSSTPTSSSEVNSESISSSSESSEENSPVPRESSEASVFVDSVGRKVEIPANIQRIAPSGPIGQMIMLTLAPNKMVGLASKFDDTQSKFFDSKILDLPELGNLYGDTLNMETILLADPQLIIDIGEAKKSTVEDMDKIQETTGIPTIFIEMNIDNMSESYLTLGDIVGEQEQAQKLSDYINTNFAETKAIAEKVGEDKVSVYYCIENGLTTVVADTIHSDVIDYAGAKNIAEVESTLRGGTGEISMEQLIIWNPDIILFTPDSIYDTVADTPEWQEVRAIKENKYYEIPASPYNWMGRPASVNRFIGIKWLGNLLYPELFEYDMIEETKEFYELFYHYKISDDEVRELLSKSTFREE